MATVQKRTQLSARDLGLIRQLVQACNHFEGLTMKLNWQTLQNRPGTATDDFLIVHAHQLIGYLALYSFNQKEAEVSAMTHPRYRRRGIFKQLLAEARQTLTERTIPELLFICEQKAESGRHCMAAIGSRYAFSEYKMTLGSVPASDRLPQLALRPARPDDYATMAHLDHLCFGVEPDITLANLANEQRNRHRRNWIVLVNGEVAGKIQIAVGAEEIYLFGFCLLPKFRGRGYGRSVLAQIVTRLANERRQPLSLEVAATNRQALKLYQSCGFHEVTAYDYYRQPV